MVNWCIWSVWCFFLGGVPLRIPFSLSLKSGIPKSYPKNQLQAPLLVSRWTEVPMDCFLLGDFSSWFCEKTFPFGDEMTSEQNRGFSVLPGFGFPPSSSATPGRTDRTCPTWPLLFSWAGDTGSMGLTDMNYIPQDPWDWYIYLHLVDFYGKCR